MSLIPPTPSRFAVLPDDDPTDFTPKPDKNAKKKAKKAAANEANKSGKPAKAKAKSSNDGDLKAAAFGTKSKGSKNKKNNKNSEKKDEEAFQEWKEKDKKVCVFYTLLSQMCYPLFHRASACGRDIHGRLGEGATSVQGGLRSHREQEASCHRECCAHHHVAKER